MEGTIIRGVGGFYYVDVPEHGVYECRARGIFRHRDTKPLVGDRCAISVQDEAGKKGNVDRILPRQNALIRPAVANIDQALVIFALKDPALDRNLIDRFLVSMEYKGIPSLICLNKEDLVLHEDAEELRRLYSAIGYKVFVTSAKDPEDPEIGQLMECLYGKTTAVAGPSGVGKSSLINLLQDQKVMETGAISEKIARGRNTTRHAELLKIREHSYICDTPGFTSLDLPVMEKEELSGCFPEFREPSMGCRFRGCTHIAEPDCMVKRACAEGRIASSRYRNYCMMFEELKDRRRY